MVLRERLSGNGGRTTAFCRVALCPSQDLTLKTQLEAVNGKKMPALEVFAHALRFFKEHALQVRCAPNPGPPFPLSHPWPLSEVRGHLLHSPAFWSGRACMGHVCVGGGVSVRDFSNSARKPFLRFD